MNDSLSFDVDAGHFARQLHLNADHAIISAFGRRCSSFLQLAVRRSVAGHEIPYILLRLLQPPNFPPEYSTTFGIFSRLPAGQGAPPLPVGVLSLFHPLKRTDHIWCINLLLLRPDVRGRGLGAAIHRALVPWAAARGARELVASVADNNPRAWHFWHDRIGYQDADSAAWQSANQRASSHGLQYHLGEVQAAPPWGIPEMGGSLVR